MKNDGKLLENTIRLVQETLKNSPNTKIFSNYKIENESGNLREFDIIIESIVNDFQIRIAIECKDHINPIPVGLIESFESKCSRIKSINKKVFISRNGYQKDSIDAARTFGIELLTAEKVSVDTITNWLNINQLNLRLTNEFTFVEIYVDPAFEIEKKSNEFFNGKIYRKGDPNEIDLLEFIIQNILDNSRIVQNLALVEWLRLEESKKFSPFQIQFQISFENYFIKDQENNNVELQKIKAGLNVYYVKSELNLLDAREIKGSNNTQIAKTLQLDTGKNTKTDMIIKEDIIDFFHTDREGNTRPLKHLFTYNPKKDSFE